MTRVQKLVASAKLSRAYRALQAKKKKAAAPKASSSDQSF